MKQIDAILELAKSLDPTNEDKEPTFVLRKEEDGKWYCEVNIGNRWLRIGDGWPSEKNSADSADEALRKMHDGLVHLNQTFVKRMTSRLAKWLKIDGPSVVTTKVAVAEENPSETVSVETKHGPKRNN